MAAAPSASMRLSGSGARLRGGREIGWCMSLHLGKPRLQGVMTPAPMRGSPQTRDLWRLRSPRASIRACPQGRLRTLLGNSAVHDRWALTLIYDNDQGSRLTKLVANQKQCGPDSVSLKSFGMERLADRSAKQISRGERASANEKVPSQRLRGTCKNCQGSILAESVRFELTDAFTSAVFKTAGLNHSPNSPEPAILCRRRRPTPRRAGTSTAGHSGSRGRARSAIRGTGRGRRGPCVRPLPNRAGSTSSPAPCAR